MATDIDVVVVVVAVVLCFIAGGRSTATQIGMPFKRIDINGMIKEHGFHAGYDEEFDTYSFDEDSEEKVIPNDCCDACHGHLLTCSYFCCCNSY
jgi:broad-specificity NMP kinase